jgi:hypothetical protein
LQPKNGCKLVLQKALSVDGHGYRQSCLTVKAVLFGLGCEQPVRFAGLLWLKVLFAGLL